MRALALAAILAFAFVCVASSAHAQPGLVEPRPLPPQKSTHTAVALALGTTLAGITMLAVSAHLENNCYGSCSGADMLGKAGAVALLVGPSLGHAYAGHTWNAGLGIRLGGMTMFGLGFLAMVPCWVSTGGGTPIGGGGGGGGGISTCQIGAAAATVGAVATVAGMITEIATTPSAVSDYNQAHAWPTFTVAAIPTASGVTPGVALAGRF